MPTPVNLAVKLGIKLPKTKKRWAEANAYFAQLFASRISEPIDNLDDAVQVAQNEVYNYFADTFGTIPVSSANDFIKRYDNQSVKDLKRTLKLLKSSAHSADIKELKYVSALIRTKLASATKQVFEESTDIDLKTKFWPTCQKIFSHVTNLKPSFSISQGFNYFVNTVSQTDKLKQFTIPNWIPTLPPPTNNATIPPPTYRAVATAIGRCRPGASACPLDQLSILILKNCPILRTLLHKLITECWAKRNVPECWKRGASVLIHKRGDQSDPSNFRPITLQPVWYKIFSSVYANMLYEFVVQNSYIDKNIQKGFWRGVDGVTEHTELLAHIINDARRVQRSITVALLDLKNAFGEVHHNLIVGALHYHHVPSELVHLFQNIYGNNYVTVAVGNEWTNPIKIERGVLQGDPSSPLLFNLCINTLMRTLDQPIYRQLGYSWGPTGGRKQRAWMQFADDCAIIALDSRNAQGLLNVFVAWCSWSSLVIRVDKCITFGMQKRGNKYLQILPVLSIESGQIPQVGINGEFTYLGRRFSYDMSNTSAKIDLVEKLSKLLNITDKLKLRVQNKLKILFFYIHAQVLYEIKLYNFPVTWVKQSLDALCIRHISYWLELPISACVKQ